MGLDCQPGTGKDRNAAGEIDVEPKRFGRPECADTDDVCLGRAKQILRVAVPQRHRQRDPDHSRDEEHSWARKERDEHAWASMLWLEGRKIPLQDAARRAKG